jgi:Fe-S cluster assembly iron-binding protein IscA
MIEVTELAKVKIREFLKNPKGNSPIRILVSGG